MSTHTATPAPIATTPHEVIFPVDGEDYVSGRLWKAYDRLVAKHGSLDWHAPLGAPWGVEGVVLAVPHGHEDLATALLADLAR